MTVHSIDSQRIAVVTNIDPEHLDHWEILKCCKKVF